MDIELNMVVSDSHKAFDFYEKLFGAVLLEKTDLDKGLNEVIFKISDMQFHLLDANYEYGLVSPTKENNSMWLNVIVEDISETYAKAILMNADPIQEIKVHQEIALKNAVISDPFGHMWLIHQTLEEDYNNYLED